MEISMILRLLKFSVLISSISLYMASVVLACCIATAAKCMHILFNLYKLQQIFLLWTVTELFQLVWCHLLSLFWQSFTDVFEEQEVIIILCGVCNYWSVVRVSVAPPNKLKSVCPWRQPGSFPLMCQSGIHWNGIDAITNLIESCREREIVLLHVSVSSVLLYSADSMEYSLRKRI